MKFQRKKVATALAYVLGVGSVALLTAAPAQAADIKVDVTGSNIRRLEGEGALPVQVITREEIERTGATSALDLLQYVSANNTGGQIAATTAVGATTFSVQTASLRGLGGQNTLVLLNGKRLTQSSGEVQGVYGVNLDAIPFSAIERVEVLKDGASAVYGSDAIGGVINFILRQDFTGIEAKGYYGVPTRGGGGGEIGNATLTAGWGDLTKDKFNIFGSIYYQKAEALQQNKRNFSDSSLDLDQGLVGVSGNTFPGFITTGGIGSIGYPNCAPSIPGGDLGARCFYDPAAADGVNSIPETETTSVFVSGKWQFNPDWQAYGTFAYTKQENRVIIQPTPLSDQITYGPNAEFLARFLLPPTSPYYPTAAAIAAGVNGQPLNVRYRAYALGNRDTTDTNDQWQGVVGVKGSRWNWDFDFDFVYSKSETKQQINNGFARYSQIVPLLNSGLVNPFGQSSDATEAALQALQYRQEAFNGESTGYMFEGKASGDLAKLPAGALSAAIGFQAGKQTLKQNPNGDLALGDITGFGGNLLPNDASRTTWAVYGELAIPIVKTLEATAAVRYDHYSDFGNTTNPKFSLRWNPAKELLFRGSWGTGFVAADAGVRPQHVGPVAGRPGRSAALPDDEGHQRLLDAVHVDLRRQPGPQAAEVDAVDSWRGVGAGHRILDRLRLVRPATQGPVQQRRHAQHHPPGPGAVRQPDHPGTGAAAVPDDPGSDHQHRPALHQPGRSADRGLRRRPEVERAGNVDRPLLGHAVGYVLLEVRRPAAGRHVCRVHLQRVRRGDARHHAALQAVRDGDVAIGSVAGDARQPIHRLVHRRKHGRQRQPAARREPEHLGPLWRVHGIQELESRHRREEPVRHRPAVHQPAVRVPGRLRSDPVRRTGTVRVRHRDLHVQISNQASRICSESGGLRPPFFFHREPSARATALRAVPGPSVPRADVLKRALRISAATRRRRLPNSRAGKFEDL